MKKTIVILMVMLLTYTSKAQRASFVNDTARYNGKAYAIGDTITLGYGSKANKDFAFIQIGSMLTGLTDLAKNWSKWDAVIDKISIKGKSIYFRAKLVDKTVNAVGGNKLFIDLEGAIDNKELKE